MQPLYTLHGSIIYTTSVRKNPFSFASFQKINKLRHFLIGTPFFFRHSIHRDFTFNSKYVYPFGGILMSIIVSKFGGSSMADAEMFRKVRSIVTSRNRRQYIVLSAPGRRYPGDVKITDLLCRAHQYYVAGKDETPILSEIKNRFTSIIRELGLDIDPEELLYSLPDDIRHSADRAASRGEYLCAKIFAAYSDIPFIDADRLIHFDKNGRIQREEIQRAVCAMAKRLPCAIIPGFYGSLPNGEIKTFSRGGSDITGSLIAAALNADIYENWTDVDGLMSIDPAVCGEAILHPAVSYRQMRMLAQSGAQVLHPYCVEPVCEAGIPTILKNTFRPQRPGTYISDRVRYSVPCVCALNGYSAVSIDQLSAESRIIAEGLHKETYLDVDCRKIIAIQSPSPKIGQPVCILSAFGLPPDLRAEAYLKLNPLADLHTDQYSKYLIRPESVISAQKLLHELLITESRNPSNCDEPCRSTT